MKTRFRTATLVLLLSVMTVEAPAAEFVGGPYLCNPRMAGMTVGWVSDTANAGEVEYGRTEAYGKKAKITLCDRILQAPILYRFDLRWLVEEEETYHRKG